MAPTHDVVVPQHQRGDAPIPIVKQNAAAGGDGNNCQARGYIRNLAKGNPLPQYGCIASSDPKHLLHSLLSRISGAQLLVSGQLATIATADKKPVVGDAVVAVGKGCTRVVKPKVIAKPKPEEFIEISPDTNEPKDLVHDIDALDADNHLAVVDYVEDIYKFYKLAENFRRPNDYMVFQVEINEEIRAIVANCLIEVHHKFGLMPEVLFLTFYILDRYLSVEVVRKWELLVVGMSALLIACKYEDVHFPKVDNFIRISKGLYSREQILSMEKEILNKLEWNLTVPTPYMFLVRYLKAAMSDKEMEHMAFFFAELSLMHYSMIMYRPSLIAASAVYAARCTLKKTPFWCETLKHHTGFLEPQLLYCAQQLVNFHSKAAESELKVVYEKYSSPQCGAVALHPPATKLLDELKEALIHDGLGIKI